MFIAPRFILPLLVISWVGSAAPAQPVFADIDALAKEALKNWRVPGLALAIVKDDRVFYLQGYGVRDVRNKEPITPDTVFPLASCTKSFTATMLGMLADDGKLGWDDPVRKHLPYFRLADPLADREVTLRDLLAHRTGVGSHDLLWYKSPFGLEERIRRTCRLDLHHSFRSNFTYQTIFFGAAGEAGAKAAATPWRDLIQRRLLDPLEMKNSRPTQPGPGEKLIMAEPHSLDPMGKAVPMERYPLDQADPAGSIHATARDVAKYLRFQLSRGAWNGKRLISESNLAETHTPQIVLVLGEGGRRLNPDTVQMSYGLGWIIQDYRGHGMVLHGGVINGFRTQLTLIPKARLGIALMNNLDHTYMNYPLTNQLVDLMLGLSNRDWHSIVQEAIAKSDEEQAEQARAFQATRKRDTRPSLPLNRYAGRYEDSAYGKCEMIVEENKLIWRWGKFRVPLTHFHDEVFLGTGEVLLADAPFTFQVKEGKVDQFTVLERRFRRLADQKDLKK